MTFRVLHEPGRGLLVEPIAVPEDDPGASLDATLAAIRGAREPGGARPAGLAALEVFADALARAEAEPGPDAPPSGLDDLAAAARDAAATFRSRASGAGAGEALRAVGDAFAAVAAAAAAGPDAAGVRGIADRLAAAAALLERAGARPPPEEEGE